MPTSCRSAITQVVVHARGARVTRKVQPETEPGPGDVDLLIPGITVLAEGASLRAQVIGGQRSIVSVQAALVMPAEPLTPGPITERRMLAQNRLARLEEEAELLDAQQEQLASLELNPVLATGRLRRDTFGGRFEEALGFGGLLHALVTQLDARRIALDEALYEAQHERDAAALEASQASSRERGGEQRPSRTFTVRLGGEGALGELEVSYVVPAARWWPLYTLRLTEGGRKARLWLEALVAQRTGEDWSGVPLALSTADLLSDTQLPELPALRLGRAQKPMRASYREPPAGLERLFAGYDRAFPSAPLLKAGASGSRSLRKQVEVEEAPGMALDKDTSDEPLPPLMAAPVQALGFAGAPPAAAPMASRSMAMPKRKKMSAMRERRAEQDDDEEEEREGRGGGGALSEEEPMAIEPSSGWLDFDALQLAPLGDPSRRGRLIQSSDLSAGERRAASLGLESLQAGPGLCDPRESRGHFDHRYDARGRVEVPSDAQPHRVPLIDADAAATLRFRTVPRADPQVFREVELTNPFEAPLLDGPVDVYVEGSLLTTSGLSRVDRGGKLTVGLGVEDRIHLARNARTEEESAGLLGGARAVTHEVSIELVSSLGTAAALELIERIPVSDEKSVEVKLLPGKPEPDTYDQAERGSPVRGGLRWRLTLAPGQKQKLVYRYRVEINARDEIVGGNRRE